MENPNVNYSTSVFEKNQQNEIRDGGGETNGATTSTFKQPPTSKPYLDSYLRPSNPRLKPQQSKWWRNQHLYRYRVPADGLIPNNFRNVGNHVIRNLYETPSTSGSQNTNNNESEDLTKTLEAKIQNIQSSPQVQNFSESSRSSIRSLLESLSTNKSSYDYGENLNRYFKYCVTFTSFLFFPLADNLATLRLWDQSDGREPSEEIDNISLSSLLGYLDSFYDKNQDNNGTLEKDHKQI
jgi:hypothetical protein